MSLHYSPDMQKWVAIRRTGEWSSHCYVGKWPSAALFATTGWCSKSRHGQYHKPNVKGFYTRWLYGEFMQGTDICTGDYHRWLCIGIPYHGCWRINLDWTLF